jgi:diaminohydroxyphosphoribosylaminopyrimidine deaminase/5-amino-6-(5-phosphoribosylamino)uracil reductase
VVVSPGGEIVGEGAHHQAGADHAEVVALEAAGSEADGSTLYVTLEPCPHHGRTPPCVDAIIAARVAGVVVAAVDPDEHVSGKGLARLREAGIDVVVGVGADQARELDPAYFHHRETGLPRVTLKYAMTLDGAVAAVDGTSRWISGEEARRDAHHLRAEADAVIIGAGTLRSDDPLLTVRLDGDEGHQPVPVVVAGEGDLPPAARLWEREPVVIAAEPITVPSGLLVEVEGGDGLPDPVASCRALADLGYLDLLLEGGPRLAHAWWQAGVVTRGVVYVAGRMAGGAGISPLAGRFETIEDAVEVHITGVRSLGDDIRIDFEQV